MLGCAVQPAAYLPKIGREIAMTTLCTTEHCTAMLFEPVGMAAVVSGELLVCN